MTLAVDEHPRRTASMLRCGCAEVTPSGTAQGKPRRNHRHHDATAVDQPQSFEFKSREDLALYISLSLFRTMTKTILE